MTFQRSYEGPWNRRIYDLAGAMGWGLEETANHLGLRMLLSLNRVLRGGRPKVKFLLTLAKLESAYEREIADFIHQGRPFKKFARKRRSRERLQALSVVVPGRPEDIAEMGVVGTLGQSGWDGHGEGPPRPPRVVVWSDPRRYKRKENKEVKPG